MDATEAFLQGTKNCEQLKEAVEIVKKNSYGKIWLVGGFIYRTIAHQLYGTKRGEVDLDFIVEVAVSEFKLPDNWKVGVNRFDRPKLVSENKSIDYLALKDVYSIVYRNVKPTIENYLTGVPLKIQSIAFDVYGNQIIGEMGIDALNRKVVEVNDKSFAIHSAKRKRKFLRQMIQEKADSLGFTPIFP